MTIAGGDHMPMGVFGTGTGPYTLAGSARPELIMRSFGAREQLQVRPTALLLSRFPKTRSGLFSARCVITIITPHLPITRRFTTMFHHTIADTPK